MTLNFIPSLFAHRRTHNTRHHSRLYAHIAQASDDEGEKKKWAIQPPTAAPPLRPDVLRPQPLDEPQTKKKGKKPNRTIARQQQSPQLQTVSISTQPIGKSWNTCSMCIRVFTPKKIESSKKEEFEEKVAVDSLSSLRKKEADEFISIGRCNNIDNMTK